MHENDALWKVHLRYQERLFLRGIVLLSLTVTSLAPIAVDLYCVRSGVLPPTEWIYGTPGVLTLEERRSYRTGEEEVPLMDTCSVGMGPYHASLRTFKDREGDVLRIELMSHRMGPYARRALTLWKK